MAFDVPNSPIDGQTMTVGGRVWTYSTATGQWLVSSPLSDFLLNGGTVGSAVGPHFTEFLHHDLVITWPDDSPTAYSALYFHRSRGTQAAPTVLVDGDNMGAVRFFGHDGTDFQEAVWIDVQSTDVLSGDVQGQLVIGNSNDKSTGTRFRVDGRGRVQIGSQTPELNTPKFQVSGSSGVRDATVTGSISGTTLTVTAVTTGDIVIGDRIVSESAANKVQPGTYVKTVLTGSGGVGTYELTTSQTVASTTIIAYHPSLLPTMRLANYDSSADADGTLAGIEFWSADSTTGASGVRAFIEAETRDTSGGTDLVFGTSVSAVAGAKEVLRIGTDGTVTIPGVLANPLTRNAQTGTTYTVVAADNGKLVELSNAAAITVTVGTGIDTLPVGSQIQFLQTGAGQVTFSASGTTVNATPGLKLRAQWSSATLIKRASNTWVLIGDIAA